jgi:hypothetical protein
MERRWFGAVLVGAIAFAIYLRTAARSAPYGDGPELTVAAYQLGVPQPTGYPLYTLLGHLFIRCIPFGEIIFRMTLMSVIASALTIGVLYALGTALFRRRWIAAFVALFFAFTDTFWQHAVVTGVYALHMLLVTSALTCLVFWNRTGKAGYLRAAALIYGLSLAHHLMTIMWAPALILMVALSPHRRQAREQWGWVLGGLAAPLLLYLYLPLAALRDPPMNWGDVTTFRHFVDHVTGAQFRDRMGQGITKTFWSKTVNYAGWPQHHGRDGFLLSQFSIAILWLAPVGLWSLWRHWRRFLWVTVTAYVISLLWALSYNIVDPEAYYLPSHLMVALWIGYGIRELAQRLFLLMRRTRMTRMELRHVRRVFQVGVVLLPSLTLMAGWRLHDMSRRREMAILGRQAFARVAPNSIVLAASDAWLFSFLYVHYVEGLRPDIELIRAYDVDWRDWRLITRTNKHGVIVREPLCSVKARNKNAHALCRLEKVILDNYRRRPVYLAGSVAVELEQNKQAMRHLPRYEHVVEGAPMLRFLPDSRPELPSPEFGE